ncbi:hypothetical protein GCM10010991_25300 [Gemmobacter aquaticus]|uniref:Sacsin/Nov domain-containing protein n=2 Tax=Gemmobacter aquaticus TaxID=490185 RepID=A0A917YLT5_9RHOB|nr:hypothetical protein GCM10010991_25300 [Gemmobacter aquaticus]
MTMHRDEKSIIEDLRTNLKERYHFEGGRTLLRELLQNADDSGSEQVRIAVLPGWPEADHPLLRVPGLMVANDGRYDAESAQGIARFGGSVKATDTAAIGRFGMGQKTAFHVCDAFLVVSEGHETEVPPLVVNPYIVIGKPGDACLEWEDAPTARDRDLLLSSGLAGFARKMVQWYPLRSSSLKPKTTTNGFLPKSYDTSLLDDANDPFWLSGIVSLLRNVSKLEVVVANGTSIVIDRAASPRLRFDPATPGQTDFGGPLCAGIRSVGKEIMATADFGTDLTASEGWPDILDRQDDVMVRQKALPHGAVALLVDPDGRDELDITWSVFLPVASESAPHVVGTGKVRLFLHGYFFVTSGRDAILGHDKDMLDDVSAAWNARVRDELVLPLLPGLLMDALESDALTEEKLHAVVSGLNASELIRNHRTAISSRQVLARTLSDRKIGWTLKVPSLQFRALPAPENTRLPKILELIPDIEQRMAEWNLVPTVGSNAVLAPVAAAWQDEELARMAGLLTPTVFGKGGKLARFGEFLDFVRRERVDKSLALVEPVLDLLRRAMAQRDVDMAESEHIRMVLRHLPDDCVLPMPPSVMRSSKMRRTLASVEAAPLCIHQDWRPTSLGARTLSLIEAKALLTALQPLLKDTATEDAAATAAIAILKAMGVNLAEAQADAEFRALHIVRVDKGLGFPRSASLDDLSKAASGGRLFAHNNENRKLVELLERAAPGAGAMMINYAEAAQLLTELGIGLTYAKDPSYETARLAAEADAFGPDEARLDLMHKLWSTESKYRPYLRALLAGRREARFDDRDLLWIEGGNVQLDTFARTLVGGDDKTILLSSTLLMRIDAEKQGLLGVRRFDGAVLGQKFVANQRYIAAAPISSELLSAFFTANIPDEDLERLPIFETNQGRVSAVQGYRHNPDLPFPDGIDVPILQAPFGNAAQEQFRRITSARIWSAERQLVFLLRQPEPARYGAQIIASIREGRSPETLPLLAEAPWLTLKDGHAVAPASVMDLPGLNSDLLPADIATRNDLPVGLLDEDTLRLLVKDGVLKDAAASKSALLDRLSDGSLPCWFGERPGDIAAHLQSLAKDGADLTLPGWPLLAWLLSAPGAEALTIMREVQQHGAPDPEHFHGWMDALSRIAASGSHAARAVYDSGFRLLARTSIGQIGKILSGTLVPTRDGTWRAATEVVAHGGAVAFPYRLDPELSRLLPQTAQGSSDDPRKLRLSDPPAELTEKQSADSLRPILARAKVAVPAEMLAVLVFMLGRSDYWRALMREELGLAAPVIEGIERDFESQVEAGYRKGSDQSLKARSARMRIQFRPRRDLQGEDEFVSIAGTSVMLPLGDAQPLEIVGTIYQNWKNEHTKDLHSLKRRRALDVVLPDDVRLTDRHVTEFCRTLAEEYVGSVKDQPEARAALDALLAGRARFAEHVASAVRAEIRDQMPKILGEMKPRPGGILERARKDYEDAVRGAGDGADAIRKDLKDRLWTTVDQPVGHAELLERVRARITEDGYTPARIFFELFQNADDAWQQDPAWTDAPGRFELSRNRGTTTMKHWGRLINVVGTGSHGERMGWHRDLYHMLLLNLSDKDRAEAVTGKFGLGFKAVHLLADQVRIASRHVACHVHGGLLPDPWDQGKERSFGATRKGRPATIIEFDQKAGQDYDAAWDAFRRSARWLPAMARGIRQVDIRKEALAETFGASFEDTGTENVRILTLTGTESGKALVLDLDEDTTLFLPLGPTGPIPPAEGTPGLWLLAPLDVDARPRWLMNSRSFAVNPGRGHLRGTLDERKALFRKHGTSLARRLKSLAKLLENDWPAFAQKAGLSNPDPEEGRSLFWTALADNFIPDLRHDLLGSLHMDDTRPRDITNQTPDSARLGWASLVSDAPVFPTGLAAPFAPLLRATDVRWQVAGVMDFPGAANRLAGHPAAQRILSSSVSSRAARTLERIGLRVPSPLHGGGLLAEALKESRRIDPELASWLGGILSSAPMKQDEREQALLHLRTATFCMADGRWGPAAFMPYDNERADPDERLISEFVPSDNILSGSYTGDAISLYELARGSGHLGSLLAPARLAQFARECKTIEAKRAVVTYMVRGERGRKLAEELGIRRCSWLPPDFEAFCKSDFAQGLNRNDLLRHVLPHLYAGEHEERLDGTRYTAPAGGYSPTGQLGGQANPALVLERLHAWWSQESQKLCSNYNVDTYPANSKPERLLDKHYDDDPEGWFTFFAQAVFRSIEWGNAAASRNFIKDAKGDGWWGEMARISQVHSYKPWTDRLEELARIDGKAEDYRPWRRALGELYVVARWLPEYVDVYQNLPRFVEREGAISLVDHWWPSASPLHQRRGTEGASLIRTLGNGANWMIREGVRAGIWGDLGGYMHSYGWAKSSAMVRFADRIGWRHLLDLGGMDASRVIYSEFEAVLRERASFGGALDLPIQLLMTQKHEGAQEVIFGPDTPRISKDNVEEEDFIA